MFYTVSCDKSSVPDVTTKEVTEITAYSARTGGIIDDDHGEPVIGKGVVWNTDGNPTYSENVGRTDDGDGMGEYNSTMTDLTPATTYYFRAYAISSEGTGYGDELMFETLEGDSQVVDIDGNVYGTVTIGNQEWLAVNLRVTRYNNGDAIPTGLSDTEWSNTTSGAYAIYNNDNDMLEAYGKLYNWFAVDDARGLCPEGWSVPSDDDWTQLVDYVASQGFPNDNETNGSANALKSCRQADSPLGGDCDTSEHPRWNSHNTHYGFDEFGFSALPGGARLTSGYYFNFGYDGFWWSSSEYSSLHAWRWYIGSHFGNVSRGYTNKKNGFSVRCFRDIEN